MELGHVVKDSITGFTGTITARAVYLHSNPMVLVESHRADKEDGRWLYEDRVSVTQG